MSHLAVARRLRSGIAHGRDWRGLRRLLSEGDTDETAGTDGGARAWRHRGPGPGPGTAVDAASYDRARSWRLRGRVRLGRCVQASAEEREIGRASCRGRV